jgi:superoxide dismutase
MREIINLFEGSGDKIEILPVAYKHSDLAPVFSAATLRYHYTELAHGYAQRFNQGQGDPAFNSAGAFLHNLFFQQFRPVTRNNLPTGPVAGSTVNSVLFLIFVKKYPRWLLNFRAAAGFIWPDPGN